MNKLQFTFEKKTFRVTLVDQASRSVWSEIFKLREYKVAEEIIRTNKDPIIDVGAHVGLFSLYCRVFNTTVPIYALEPEAENFELLNQHIRENNLTKIKTFKSALSYQSGTAELFVSDDSHNHYLSRIPTDISKETDTHKPAQIVQTFSLRDFLNQEKILRVGLLKMDIEGGEYDVFESCNADDFARVRFIIMEYHNYEGQHYSQIENLLRSNGFGVQIFPSKFDKRMGFLFANNKRI